MNGFRIKQELTYRDIDGSVENVWSVLYATGYLTGTHVEQADADIFRLWMPNGEIRKLFYELVEDWFREVTRSDTARIDRFCEAFPKGDVATIQDMLSDYLWDSISVRDTAVRRNMKENFYHGLLLGLLRSDPSWLILSNAESGDGFSDILIEPEDPDAGIVIEVKYSPTLAGMERTCEAALDQIRSKRYDERLRSEGRERITAFGITFCKKRCRVAPEMLY